MPGGMKETIETQDRSQHRHCVRLAAVALVVVLVAAAAGLGAIRGGVAGATGAETFPTESVPTACLIIGTWLSTYHGGTAHVD